MKYKVGDEVKVFNKNEKKTIKRIGIFQSDIWGNEVEMYEVEGEFGLYVDIYDGTIARA